MDQDALERKLFVVRKRIEAAVAETEHEGQGILLHSVVILAHHCL